MNCQDALDLLYDIIDREASEIDAQRVKEHLENCRDCFEIYRLEQSVQKLIDEKVRHSFDTPKVEDLKLKIMSRLDEIDRETPDKRETRFFRFTTRTMVAAASLVILIGASLLVAAFYRHGDKYLPLERAHWAAVQNIETYSNSSSTEAVLAAVRENHQFEILNNVLGHSLLGASNGEIMGAPMSHLVYRQGERIVSVFLAPVDRFEVDGDLEKSKIVKNNIIFFDHNCRGCRLVYHIAGSLVVITASTDRDFDLLDFVPEMSVI